MPSEDLLPLFAVGEVVKGFGRGSKQLGIPTANYPPNVVNALPEDFKTGVYFGFASVNNGPVYKMVMSVGWNPFYQNKEKSMETYILHEFPEDFYGQVLHVGILGYIRPQRDFDSVDELIKTIKEDIDIADKELESDKYQHYKQNTFFPQSP